MKTEIISAEEITKEFALSELQSGELDREGVDEYLDIIAAINKGQRVLVIVTNKDEYLMYIDKEPDEL